MNQHHLGSAAIGSAIGLEVAGSGPVSCRFFHSLLLFAMCSSLACLHLRTMVRRPSSLIRVCSWLLRTAACCLCRFCNSTPAVPHHTTRWNPNAISLWSVKTLRIFETLCTKLGAVEMRYIECSHPHGQSAMHSLQPGPTWAFRHGGWTTVGKAYTGQLRLLPMAHQASRCDTSAIGCLLYCHQFNFVWTSSTLNT